MLRLSSAEERITAVLHDVVEDCGWSLARLEEEGFSTAVIAAVDSVTRKPDESYEDFVLRAAANPIGRRVKMADLEDNMDLSHIAHPSRQDHDRIEKYRKAMATIHSLEPKVNTGFPSTATLFTKTVTAWVLS